MYLIIIVLFQNVNYLFKKDIIFILLLNNLSWKIGRVFL